MAEASSNPILISPQTTSRQSFVQRLIEINVQLAGSADNNSPPTFQGTGIPGADGTNSVTLSGSRVSAQIENHGAPAGSVASVKVYGMAQSLMNQFTALGLLFESISRNVITISAGDAVAGMAPVFTGTILWAYGDYNSAPKVSFNFDAFSGAFDAVNAATPSTFPPGVDVATAMSGLASKMQLGFINAGVNVKMPGSVYLPGDYDTQVKTLAEHAHIRAERVLSYNGNQVLAIWPFGGSWNSGSVPLVSPTTGMIGYPSFSPNGLMVKMVFNPQVSFGSLIQVQSSLPQANKQWVVQKLDLALDTLTPHGQWMATAYCFPVGFLTPAPGASTP